MGDKIVIFSDTWQQNHTASVPGYTVFTSGNAVIAVDHEITVIGMS